MCWAASYSCEREKTWITHYTDSGEKNPEGTSTQQMMMYKAGHQKVEIPQKRDPECLPDNYDMVVKRMMITEKELLQDDKTANEFNQIIERSCQNFGERS